MSAIEVSSLITLAYATLAFADGFVLHLWKYRLFAYAETRYEHLLHTMRALIFPLLAWSFFAVNLRGILLLAALSLAGLDLVVQFLDMFEEYRARKRFGGLSSLEYSLHVVLTGLHGGLIVAYILSRPVGAFSWDYFPAVPEAFFVRKIAELILPGAVLALLIHLILFLPYFQRFGVKSSQSK